MITNPSVPVLTSVIASAREAQALWAAVSPHQRARKLSAVERYIADSCDDLSSVICEDTGKTRVDALATEVVPAALALRYYRRHADRFLKEERIACGNLMLFNKRSRLSHQPYGVVGIISPWNYPFAIPFSEVVMALLAGNAVILKVASATPLVGRSIERALESAGLPAGLFTYIEMSGKEAGPAFIEAGIDKLFFTGSTAVGRELMARAAERLLPVVLELGGADAAYIRYDAHLERAANGILWAGYSNAGQSCGGCQRILVDRRVYEPFVDLLSRRVRALRLGPGASFDSDMGPLISVRQKEDVCSLVNECVRKGARIVARSDGGSLSPDGSPFMSALVLADVSPDMPIMNDEIFGPVVAVLPVDGDEHAVRIANDSPYGLTASVWTRDHRTARSLAIKIHSGAVMINDHLMSHGLAETPWTGFKQSGIGRTHGKSGFMEMVRTQVIVDDILPGTTRNLWWHPYSIRVYRGVKSILAVSFSRSFGDRIASLPRLILFFFRYWSRSRP